MCNSLAGDQVGALLRVSYRVDAEFDGVTRWAEISHIATGKDDAKPVGVKNLGNGENPKFCGNAF